MALGYGWSGDDDDERNGDRDDAYNEDPSPDKKRRYYTDRHRPTADDDLDDWPDRVRAARESMQRDDGDSSFLDGTIDRAAELDDELFSWDSLTSRLDAALKDGHPLEIEGRQIPIEHDDPQRLRHLSERIESFRSGSKQVVYDSIENETDGQKVWIEGLTVEVRR